MIREELIDEIIKHAEGSIKEQKEACELLAILKFPKNFSSDPVFIRKLLPLIIKFMKSGNYSLQGNGATFIANVACTTKENTKLALDAGAIQHLLKLLKSPDSTVMLEAVCSLRNITLHFSKEVVENGALPTLVKYLFKKKPKYMLMAVISCFINISSESKENITSIVEAGAVKPLIDLLESQFSEVRNDAIKVLLNIIFDDSERCQQILDDGALGPLKNAYNRSLHERKVASASKVHEEIIFGATSFIEKITSYCDAKIDMIIAKDFVPLIVEQIKTGFTVEIKKASNNIIENLIKYRNDYVPSLINDHNIIFKFCYNLRSKNADLIENILSTLKTIFEIAEFKKLCFQKFNECRGPERIENLKFEEDEEVILELSNWIKDFVNSGIAENNSDVNTSESLNRSRKRLPASEVEGPKIKRLKVSQEERNAEEPVTSIAEAEHDFDNPEQNQPFGQSNNNAAIETNATDNANPRPLENSVAASVVPVNNPATSNDALRNGGDVFETFDYLDPPHKFLKICCSTLGLEEIGRKEYLEIFSKIKFDQISSDSKPDNILPTNDKSGFECFSILFTGNEKSAEAIWKELNKKSYDYFNMEKSQKVNASKILTEEHLEIIVSWLKCRILVYCNETWKKYGSWNSGTEDIPLFVLEKKENGSETIYQIILSFKLEK